MLIQRPWAFWRRVQYLTGVFVLFAIVGVGVYYGYFYESATCFDGQQNGEERGVDCGGACTRICAFDVLEPNVLWSRAFEVTDGQYNAVAYIENRNLNSGTPEVSYTFSLYDDEGLITERSGTTILPPDSVYPIFEGRINTGTRVPTQTVLELGGGSVWLPASAGREQFVVESRTLRGVDNSPRLDARITNTAIEEAQEVEIVATIFDSQGTALTASRTFVDRFAGQTTEDVVFTWPEPIAKTLRSCEIPTDVVLGIDLSGSMNDDGGTPPEPITSVLNAATAFVNRLKEGDQASVVTYATDAALVRQLTSETTGVRDTIAALSIDPAEEVGSTNTGDAINIAFEEIESSRHNLNARKVFVLLTDGLANAPDEEPEQYARNAAAELKAEGTTVYTIGLGDNVNEAFLREIASAQDQYYRAVDAADLDSIYRSITASICEDGPSVIEIIPKTDASFAPLR